MRIGFDAKRAFFNRTGLGNYSRSIIVGLSEHFPQHEYHLYTPKPESSYSFCNADNIFIKGPDKFLFKQFSSFWRTLGIPGQIKRDRIDLYHGLSNEIPFGIEKSGIPVIVTIHDIIFVHHPHLYPFIDRQVYSMKLANAVRNASRIITISKQTKDDIIKHCKVAEDKISVVYLGCDALFWNPVPQSKKAEIVSKYNIPDEFILNVGTIERRKNILSIVKAMRQKNITIPLIIIGRATPYCDEIKAYIEENRMNNIFILNNVPLEDLPAFYQKAKLFVYPSIFEGFGIPILEALVSKTPVLTTYGGCFEEAGGPASMYIDPENIDDIGEKLKLLLDDSTLCETMRKNGFNYAERFKICNIAAAMMKVYEDAAG